MPSLHAIVKTLNRLKEFSDGENWTASHNDKPIGPVENVGLGTTGNLFDPKLWVRARFEENGKPLELRGERRVGHNHTDIKFGAKDAGKDVDADELVLSNRLVAAKWRVVLEYVFQIEGVKHRYRFDGTAFDAEDLIQGEIL